MGGEGCLNSGEIVVGERERVLRGLRRNARRAGNAEGRNAGAGLDQQRVGVAVITTFKFDDKVAPGESARQPDGRHAGLGAGADKAHLLSRGEAATD